MKKEKRKSFSDGIPSLAYAFISLIVSLLALILISSGLSTISFISENTGQAGTYIFYGIFLAVACYFICKHNPGSVWYVPVICSGANILSAILEPDFWKTELGILLGGGIIMGAAKGKRQQAVQSN